jgi:transposase InsO family protein
MSEHKENLTSTCGLLGKSRQVYYRIKKAEQRRRLVSEKVVGLVSPIRMEQRRIGTRKLHFMLSTELASLGVGRDRLFRILKANHMLVRPKRRYHVTTDSHHRFRKHKNMVNGTSIDRPNQVWVSDITYVGNRQNPMYLALVTDAYSKKIMGFDVSNSLDVNGSCRAMEMAGSHKKTSHKLIHHSDRGLQYCSDQYQELLGNQGIECSMTEKYDPYENAVAERINGTLKREFLLETRHLRLDVMKELVRGSVEIYNQKRPHYSSYYLTPNQMHQQSEMKMRTYKSKKLKDDVILELN